MKINISQIIKKFLSARFPAKTEERVQKWIIKDKHTEEEEQAAFEYWNELETEIDSSTYSALERVSKRAGYKQKAVTKIPLYRKFTRIAAVLIPAFILIGGYFYYDSVKNSMIEVFVAYGEEKELTLPDSSTIWLNAGTSIKYPKRFEKNQRLVVLNGEAYFAVKKDAAKPFIVQTQQLSVKVLGTEFNVKAYSGDERIITTLASGKVEVHTQTGDSRILQPNEQLIYNNLSSTISIEDVSPTETKGWMDGQLLFTNSSFQEIVQTLERRFNISIEDNTNTHVSKLYTLKFLKNEGLDDVLNVLEDVIGFTYQKQEDKIILNQKTE